MLSNRVYKRAKILATIGPATPDYESVLALIKAGVNGCRLNFSHGTYEEREQQITWIRQASKECGKPVAIVQDLCGPKIRLGGLGETKEVPVARGRELRLTFGAEYDGGDVIPVQYDLSSKVKMGERLYIFDGKIRTTVTGLEPNTVVVRVENDGVLMPRKGINLPDTDFAGDILTDKDRQDIEWGAARDIDYVAISFVQRASDIEVSRRLLREKGSSAKLISKIETVAAISDENLEGIVRASDGVMVARGDMAVEASFEVVPVVQRHILEFAHKYSRLCIVATQMLISMVDNPTPTRPEVSDIANAVIAGADCLMLSEETANGHYPLEAVQTMKRIIMYTQEHVAVRPLP
ncbi:MAG TPA: pyruvate kinase, partial [Candidatus Acidoferrum sp.]|nr:pyruvate kinase [Candidatus Acidoferrum sp.]